MLSDVLRLSRHLHVHHRPHVPHGAQRAGNTPAHHDYVSSGRFDFDPLSFSLYELFFSFFFLHFFNLYECFKHILFPLFAFIHYL